MAARAAPIEIAVVGAGPAGLIAAEVLAGAGLAVTVYDRMPSVGRKLLMAGRGGLNLTHGEPLPAFLARYGDRADSLAAAIAAFPPAALRDWAAGLGQETVVGSSGRVFPAGWKASPLLRAWLARLAAAGVRFAPRRRWLGFDEAGGLVFETTAGREAVPRPAATVLALGGASWPRLGSDGAWAAILRGDGHPVAPLAPANAGLLIPWSEPFRGRFEGTPLKRIALAAGGAARRGEAVVTATGLEGGAVYGLSRPLRDALAAGPATVTLDLRPDLSADALALRLGRPRGRQSASTFLRKTAGLPPVAIALLHEARGAALPTEAAELAGLVKALRLRATGLAGLDRAISTAGGLSFEALDDHLMLRSRPGVFAAGEMLDWEAPTGGYLLQACFATGRAAGLAAASWAMT